jgi:hypothetical protein
MEPNVLDQLRDALRQLSTLLDQQPVRTAIGLIPDAIMGPVIEGLRTILGVIRESLDELKNSLGSVGNIGDLLAAVNSLLEAAEGLAPGQRDTLEGVRAIVRTLQDLPGPEDIDEILGLIDEIVNKLAAL